MNNPFLARLKALVTPAPPPCWALWQLIAAEARQPHWYETHGVADTVDGRFDMVALVASLVMLRLEREGAIAQTAQLTECFVADMDGSLRQIGIGDMVIGKHMGRMTGALGGRLAAYRASLASDAPADALPAAIARNIFRGDATADADAMAAAVRALDARIAAVALPALLEGQPW